MVNNYLFSIKNIFIRSLENAYIKLVKKVLSAYNVKVTFCLPWIVDEVGRILTSDGMEFPFSCVAFLSGWKADKSSGTMTIAEDTHRMHRPAVAFDTCMESPTNWWNSQWLQTLKTPVAKAKVVQPLSFSFHDSS